MNFFEHQERARGTTRKLVILFILAIVSLIAVTSGFVVLLYAMSMRQEGAPLSAEQLVMGMPWEILATIAIVIIGVVVLGAVFRQLQLRSGGKAVAESLGGRLLNTGTRDPDERKVLNIVEEMAIAAGVPVPQVYLLEDPAINAFAAGHDQNDCVIGVTRGCIKLLNRDELQGVIAHEFSHIFNGDMRLNIRLIGWLYGITVLGLIGYYMMRSHAVRHVGGRRDDRGGLVLLGLGLIVIGYGGTFFGNLIKAAVSRQREFLADASAVQYTRNPAGISGALKKIGAYSYGSELRAANASEVSHMLFGQGIKSGLLGLFATHPPLAERIRRIEPNWQGDFPEIELPSSSASRQSARVSNFAPATASGLVEQVGDPDESHLDSARKQLQSLPAAVVDAAHTTLGATLLAFGLLLECSEQPMRRRQLGWLHQRFSPSAYQQLQSLMQHLQGLPRPLYLPVLELSLPALRALSEPQLRSFLHDLKACMLLDEHLSLFEWCLLKILQEGLVPHRLPLLAKSLNALRAEVGIVLSALASAGNEGQEKAQQAFYAASEVLPLVPAPEPHWQAYPDLKELEQAFFALRALQPLDKRKLLTAMVRCVEHDGSITPEEHELVRVAAAVLDCPMPPLKLAI